MKKLNCVFCSAEVLVPPNLSDPTARAVCDACYARGGRLPHMSGPNPWRMRVDRHGRLYSVSSESVWAQVKAECFSTPGRATFYTLVFTGVGLTAVACLFLYPLNTILFGVLCGGLYWAWSNLLKR